MSGPVGRISAGWCDGPEPVVLGFDGSAAPGGDDTLVVATLSGRIVTVDFTEVDLRPIIIGVEQAVAQMAAATAPQAPERTYPDDGLHPANRLEWLQTVEGRTADGEPLLVCEHCGEPVPCVEAILRHMDTGSHRWCLTIGFCQYARHPLDQLPGR